MGESSSFTTKMLRVAVHGAAGRMGRAVTAVCSQAEDVEVVAAIEREGCELLGHDAGDVAGVGHIGVPVCADPRSALAGVDTLIDFSRSEATLALLPLCREGGVSLVVGTTGLDPAARAAIAAVATSVGVVFAANMSVGVNLCFYLLEQAARALGDGFDVEIIEAHHRRKVDAPSGTALRMGEVVAGALGRDLDACAVYGRHGIGRERDGQTIGFATIRAGDIVGEHTVLFAGAGERVEITHRAASRTTFASGALRAARWLVGRKAGLYDMQDVLGLR